MNLARLRVFDEVARTGTFAAAAAAMADVIEAYGSTFDSEHTRPAGPMARTETRSGPL
jgi:hypothetical protein